MGFGRLGADFWPVLTDKRGRKVGRLCEGRFPKSQWRNLNIVSTLFEPGKSGAIVTARFEMLREGVQECEARIFIEKALSGGKLPKGLADRCRVLLDERTKAIQQTFPGKNADAGYAWYVDSNWQARSDKLYAAAAEVAARLERR